MISKVSSTAVLERPLHMFETPMHTHTIGAALLTPNEAAAYIQHYNGPIYLDRIKCEGGETSLLDCESARDPGDAECTAANLVAVHCEGRSLTDRRTCQ